MKILFVTPRFYPEIGGVEKHTYRVATFLSNHVESVEILTSTPLISFRKKEQIGKLLIYRLFIKKKNNLKLNLVYSLFKKWLYILRKMNFFLQKDIIHLHDYETFLWFVPFLCILRKRLFITFHGFESYPVPLGSKVIRKITEKCVSGNICVGSFISKWYGAKPTFITLGATAAPDLTSLDQLNTDIVFIGRLAEDTGIVDFLLSLSILKQRYGVNMRLHICGDGDLKPYLVDFIKKNDLNVVMHGFVEQPEIYLSKCRYAFVSGYLSILEAMSYQCIVLTIYTNPLKRDYIYSIPNAEDMLVIASSPSVLAEKLYYVIMNPQQAKIMSRLACTFARQQTWDKLGTLYLNLYGRVIG